ncbi:MAG: hypothetical protein Q4G47_04590 [Lachnospiraceae bacterium]|nr:hypothetical protein [Lachnospiraceae bacterium]
MRINSRKVTALIMAACTAAASTGYAVPASDKTEDMTAVYLGVENYGAEETNKDNKENFRYRFETDGKEAVYSIMNGTKDEKGNFDYPIQNVLKEGYEYTITVEDGVVTHAEEIAEEEIPYEPLVSGEAGVKTLQNFLKTALAPVGTTLYIYGGGWDWQDVGSSIQARTLGVSSDWVEFFESQDEDYTFKEVDGDEKKADPANSYYPYGAYNEYYYAGLDCSGYLGWVLYNTFETENGGDGYVGGSTGFAKRLSERGWGEWTQDLGEKNGSDCYDMKPGDIMSIHGHVWISLGTCDDGSVVIAHSTPSKSWTGQPGGGVQISAIGKDESCEAYALADEYMSECYPLWYERYGTTLCDPNVYFTFEGENAGRFTWNITGENGGLEDAEAVQGMKPAEVLEILFA